MKNATKYKALTVKQLVEEAEKFTGINYNFDNDSYMRAIVRSTIAELRRYGKEMTKVNLLKEIKAEMPTKATKKQLIDRYIIEDLHCEVEDYFEAIAHPGFSK